MTLHDEVLARMFAQADAWDQADDQRGVFLRCYAMMTGQVLADADAGGFADAVWVRGLLCRFADYYFDALAAYDSGAVVPEVWRIAFDACTRRDVHVLQQLMLGVNAHIRYDLVFTLADVLRDQWPQLSDAERARRLTDHRRVNEVIYRTIDSVQDQVLERNSRAMAALDLVMGRLDEYLIYRVIMGWRDIVWQQACALMACTDSTQIDCVRAEVEAQSVESARAILGERGVRGVLDLF
ncbi:MAG: hypothetical protein IPM16_21350 [Chloroflexi bacterium]|nr:hypothetical protein [Chloroflexota bacterium]